MRRRRPSCAFAALALAVACARVPAGEAVEPARLAALSARAERARGLRFEQPVAARAIQRASLEALLTEDLDRTLAPQVLARESTLAQALGLLPAGTDLREILLSFQREAVAGFYLPSDAVLYVVAGSSPSAGAGEDEVLLHELAHGLQDQTGRALGVALGVTGNDDLLFALGAFIEGEALWAEFRDASNQSGTPQITPAAFERSFGVEVETAAPVPRLLQYGLLRQYPLGYALAFQLEARGGTALLDAAAQEPPLSSSELLHPERYTPGGPRSIPSFPAGHDAFAPDARCVGLASNSYGELGLLVWLLEGNTPSDTAAALAARWDGDRAWLLDCPEGPALAWLIQLGDGPSASALMDAARLRGVAAEPRFTRADYAGVRVLFSAGLAQAGRDQLLHALRERRYAKLDELLADHPEILRRAEELRTAP